MQTVAGSAPGPTEQSLQHSPEQRANAALPDLSDKLSLLASSASHVSYPTFSFLFLKLSQSCTWWLAPVNLASS